MRARPAIVEAALELAWSHWGALGVRGAVPLPDTAVDPEALVCLTLGLIDLDPRLRDEVMDWWARLHRFVSRARLQRLARDFPQAASRLAALERELAGARTSGKARLERLDHPSRSLLRLRCALGVSARAEILLALSTAGADEQGATALGLSEVGYSKRNIALVLDNLRLAGLVVAWGDGNRTRYRLRDRDGLRRLFAPLPTIAGRWHQRMAVIGAFVELARQVEDKAPPLQAVEARRVFARHASALVALGLGTPPAVPAERYWEVLQRWLVDNLVHVAAPARREIPGMLEGVWLAPGQALRKPPRFTSAILPPLGADPERDPELVCLNLVQAPTVDPPNDWAWVALSEAGAPTSAHAAGIARAEAWHFATWHDGEPRAYLATRAHSLARDDLAPLFGREAAAIARRDSAAMLLRLRRVSVAPLLGDELPR